MLVLALAIVILAVTAGYLWTRLLKMRRDLRAARREVAIGASFERDKLAILQAANEVLLRRNQRLQRSFDDLQQEFGGLGYSISHDLRAPLRSVNGFAQALGEDYGPRLDATAQDYLRRVRAGASQMDVLIDELLALSRIVRAPFHPELLDLSVLVHEIALEFASADPGRRIEWDIEPGLAAWGDRALLGSALRHLLGNAWKFSAGQSLAHLSFRTAATGMGKLPVTAGPVYEVKDDGVGFDMQYAGKLFGVFQRMHGVGEFPGHGVGLAAAQRIIRRHGGSIQASAEPGRGAMFSFTLDASPDGEVVTEVLPAQSLALGANPPTDVPAPAQPKATAV